MVVANCSSQNVTFQTEDCILSNFINTSTDNAIGDYKYPAIFLRWKLYKASLSACPEGVKWEVGFAYFCTRKTGFGSLRLGIANTKLGIGNTSIYYTACIFHVPKVWELLKKLPRYRKTLKRNQLTTFTTQSRIHSVFLLLRVSDLFIQRCRCDWAFGQKICWEMGFGQNMGWGNNGI